MKHSLLSGATLTVVALALTALKARPAYAHDGPHALAHAPIGVMADHRHKKGELMLSYRFSYMDMDGSRNGTKSLKSNTIATQSPNVFAGQPMQPPTLRVVPLKMPMKMHMIGAMYGLSDRISLTAMGSVATKDMTHKTYMGGMGTTKLGEFETRASGFGDTTIGAIIGLDGKDAKMGRQINLNMLLSVPTGSNTQKDKVLTPMSMTPTLRLPYAMQLGTGTWDIKPGITIAERSGTIGWGGQGSARIALGKNDEGYKFGDKFEATGWIAYSPNPALSISARIKAQTQGRIDGADAAVIAPVQTANPDHYGGDEIWGLVGLNTAIQSGALKGHRFAIEAGLPIKQNLNGPQLETDFALTTGWQAMF